MNPTCFFVLSPSRERDHSAFSAAVFFSLLTSFSIFHFEPFQIHHEVFLFFIDREIPLIKFQLTFSIAKTWSTTSSINPRSWLTTMKPCFSFSNKPLLVFYQRYPNDSLVHRLTGNECHPQIKVPVGLLSSLPDSVLNSLHKISGSVCIN